MDVNRVAATYDPAVTMPAPTAGQSAQTGSAAAANAQPGAGTAEKTNNAGHARPTAEAEKERQANAKPTEENVEKALEQINKSIAIYNRAMHISVHQKTKQIMVKVMDTVENKVIRELPPEKVLDAFAKTLELAGIIVDTKS